MRFAKQGAAMNLNEFSRALGRSWCEATAKGAWSPECPALNQCAVTALVVQDCFGGELLRCEMTNGDSHYWNLLPDGAEVDLTAGQFEYIDAKPLRETAVIRGRDYVLSFPDTRKRYELLHSRLQPVMTCCI